MLLAASSPASADGITINKTKMQPARTDVRSETSLVYYISKKDCDENIVFPFSLTLATVAAGQTLEVWASKGTADCTSYESRNDLVTKPCTLLWSLPVPTSSTEITWEPGASEIANSHSDVTDCTAETATPLGITLTFLQLTAGDPAATPLATALWQDTKIQLRAPDPPAITDIDSGEASLTVAFLPPDNTTQTYIRKYVLYCDPPARTTTSSGCDCAGAGLTSGTTTTTSTTTTTTTTSTGGTGGTNPPPPAGGMGGGGTGGTGGATATTTSECTVTEHTPDSCESCDLIPGDPAPAVDGLYDCGDSTSVATGKVTASDLDNGVGYAVGLAIVDKVGNISSLSSLECATPAEVTDFYESYRARGGKAGGGLCAMRPGAPDTGTLAPIGTGVALLLLGGRRLARRRRDAAPARRSPERDEETGR